MSALGKKRPRPGSGDSKPSGGAGALEVPWVTLPGSQRDLIVERCRQDLAPLLACPPPPPKLLAAGKDTARKKQGSREKVTKASSKKIFHATTAGPIQHYMRAKLAFGINEVARALEKGHLQVMVICRDIRPIKMVQHLAMMARTTDTPFLVLPQATRPLGQAFGLQRVAALGIRKEEHLDVMQQDEGEEQGLADSKEEIQSFTSFLLSMSPN